jgi:integrase/recombinase XerD
MAWGGDAMMHAIESYLQLRRAAGFRLRDTEALLKEFACFAAERGDAHIKTDTAVAWAGRATSLNQRARRLNSLILFARYIRAEDTKHEIPPNGIFAHPPYSRPRPHIFTASEIAAILAEAKQLPPAGSLRPDTFYTLFGLVATCGLRISEALALKSDDIRPDGLCIRETKFRKSRLVPLHPTTSKQLALYLDRRQQLTHLETRVFVSLRRKPLRYPTVNETFLFLLRKLGLRAGPGQPGPRLHDLRHTFASRALENSPDESSRISKHMLALSTYLGHAHISDTYWYLQSTTHLMMKIADDCQAYLEGGRP